MLFRRISIHVKDQNWFAVGLDFFIVVAGILIAFQITEWDAERQNKASEKNYLERLHGDIIVLSEQRWLYDFRRPVVNDVIEQLTDFLDGDILELSKAESLYQDAITTEELTPRRLKSMVCQTLDWSSAFTIPPANLPTATELVSAGHLERIQSSEIRKAILSYMQDVARAEDYTNAVAEKSVRMSLEFPDYFTIRYPNEKIEDGEANPEFRCNYNAMRGDNKFLNAINKNRDAYKDYTDVGVIPVGKKLAELRHAVENELGILHETTEE